MPKYEPRAINAEDLKTLRRIVEEELRNVSQATVDDFLAMTIWHEEPKKLFRGLVVWADGTDWNPGSGEGLYRYDTAWRFVG